MGPGLDGYSERMADHVSGPQEANLLDYLAILWRRKFIILLTVVVAVAAGIGVDLARTREYSSTAQLLFLAQGTSGTSGSTNSSLTTTQLSTDVQLVQSAKVQAKAAQLLHQVPPAASVALVGTTQVADITVTSPNKQLAAQAANAYARAYVTVTTHDYIAGLTSQETTYEKQLTAIQKQISTLSGQLTNAKTSSNEAAGLGTQLAGLYTQETQLQSQLSLIQDAIAHNSSSGELVQPAVVASSPSSPKVVEDALIAGLIGLILGIGFALLRDHLDDRIRSKDDLEKAAGGLPAIGLIPTTGEWRDGKTPYLIAATRPKSPAAEAFRGLRTSVRFAGLDKPIKVLQVTSPSSADGKTTTSANLAWTMAESGQTVVLVDCDLRRPRVHDFFGLTHEKGMTSVLLGESTLAEALQPVPNQPRLRVLASGSVPPNPSELLSSRATADIFKALSNHADIVILDSAPVLPVTDAAVLATHADAVILVASAGISTRRGAARALETLSRVNAPLIGVVLNRTPDSDAYVYYGYGYGYEYGSGYGTYGNGNGSSNGDGEPEERRRGRSGGRRGSSGGRHAAPAKGSTS